MSRSDLPPASRRDTANPVVQSARGVALVVGATVVTVAAGWIVALVVAWAY